MLRSLLGWLTNQPLYWFYKSKCELHMNVIHPVIVSKFHVKQSFLFYIYIEAIRSYSTL